MQLYELRKLIKVTESLNENTEVYIDFCGYTSDASWLESIEIVNDGERDTLNVGINGKEPYKA